VAIVGAGPSGFYTAEHLLKRDGLVVEIDLFDRLPTPFGLVRGGVAPDHQKIKSVNKVYDRIAAKPNVRFFGNVELGKHVTLEELKEHYHQIVFTTGAQTDRNLNIPGEDLEGSHAATEFVAWYNGHPDYRECKFDLSRPRAAVIGVGNVAADVTRILSRRPEELAQTDIADYALEALRNGKVREVWLVGRRGPAQAAFTNPEIKELGEMPEVDTVVLPEEAELDALSRESVERSKDQSLEKKINIIRSYASRQPKGLPRRLTIRFLVSPVEVLGDEKGRVRGLRLVRNELYPTESGVLRPRPTDKFEELPVDLVFRSVGYRGVPLPGVPFHEKWGVIPNDKGRILESADGATVPGLYAAGWIKRGPSGVIGTNKPDALETVNSMLDDLASGAALEPAKPDVGASEDLVRRKQPRYVSYKDWQRLDELEVNRGRELGRPRLKFTRVEEMLAALGR
jgi:ferredoxin--NADP+ reductase